MALTTAQIQNAYVAFFNRPADVAGLTYWSTYAGSTADLLNTFAQSAEYKSLYSGLNNTQTVNAVYQNLFGHAPDVAGLTYWVTQLDQGKLAIGNIADAINKGAQGTDATIISNKVTAATAFTVALDTTAEIVAYAGVNSTGLAAVKAWLAAVTSDSATLTNATSTTALNTITTTVLNNVATTGTTYALTTAADVISGTAGSDLINGYVKDGATTGDTFTSSDNIDGGQGVDTLKLTVAGDASAVVPVIKNIEILEARSVTAGAKVDASASSLTKLVADGSTGTLEFKNIGKVTDLSIANTTSAHTFTYTAGALGSTTAALNLALNAVGSSSVTPTVTIDATTDVVTSLNIAASGANFITTDNTASKPWATVKTLTVTGNGSLTLTGSANGLGAVTKVDASGNVGGVSVDLASSSNAGNVTVTGGTGNDVVKFAAAQFTSLDSIDLGAGTADKLVLADTSISTNLKAAVNAVKGVEILGFSGAGIAADVSGFTGTGTAGITSFSVETAGAVAFTGSTGSTTYSVAKSVDNNASTFAIANSVGETATTLTLNGGVKTGTTTFTGISTVNVVSTGTTSNLLGKEANTFVAGGATTSTDLVNGDNTKFVITGSQDLEIDSLKATTTGSQVDATAFTGKLTVTGSVKSDVLKGGSGNDILQVGQGASGAVASQADVLTGGAGVDTFKFAETYNTDKATTFAAILKQSAGTSGIVKITDFVAGTDKLSFSSWNTGSAAQDIGTGITLATAQTIATAADLSAVYGGITAISASTAGGALNGVVVTVSAGAAAGTYLYINDATAGVSSSNDMLINITGITGTLTANDFVWA